MPTFGSLFAGIGGIDLGLERAGWTGRWQVEWDDYCQRVLARHWPDIPRYGDITTVDWSTVERVDLLAGGFPCQPVSYAGLGRAQSDARWLWPEFRRSIRELRPAYVLVENVPGLLARGLGDVLGDLAALGYDAEWDCIPAAAVGARHRRDRVWIVAYADGRRQQQRDEGERRLPVVDAGRPDVADPKRWDGQALHQGRLLATPSGGWAATRSADGGLPVGELWRVEPDVGRVAHGVPARVDRLRSLGNAVVPQVVEVIGRALLEAAA